MCVCVDTSIAGGCSHNASHFSTGTDTQLNDFGLSVQLRRI